MSRALSRRAALSGLAAFGAAPFLGAPARADQPTAHVAVIPFEAVATPYYADALGLFKKAGLDATLETSFTNGAAIAAAVVGGSVDIGTSNVYSLVNAHARGLPFVLIAPAGLYLSSAPTDVLMVPQNSPIKGAADFEGKTIAVNGVGTSAEYGPRAWIDQHGGRASAVNFIEMAASALPAALATGRADAALVPEPFIAAAKKDARVLAKCFDAIAPRFMLSGFFTTRDWARSHPDAVDRFQAAIQQAGTWADKNPDASAQILAKVSKLSEETIRTMNRSTYPPRLDPTLIQPVIDLAVRYGQLKPFPADELIYRN